MSSVLDFIRRHKNKIVFGGIFATGVYVGHRYYEYFNKSERDGLNASSSRFSAEGERSNVSENAIENDQQNLDGPGGLVARNMYVFNSNQKTCENTISDLIPTLKDSLTRRYNIEALLEELQNCAGSDKVALWETIKVMSFSRLFAASYSYSLLLMSLKVQISIVSGDIFAKHEIERKQKESFDFSGVFRSIFGSAESSFITTQSVKSVTENSAQAQQIFLQTLQYFLTQGYSSFADKIDQSVRDAIVDLPLTTPFTLDGLTRLFAQIRSKIHCDPVFRHLSLFVVPLSNANGFTPKFPSGDRKLADMLDCLKTAIGSRQFGDIFVLCVDEFLRSTLDFLRLNKTEWSSSEKIRVGLEAKSVFHDKTEWSESKNAGMGLETKIVGTGLEAKIVQPSTASNDEDCEAIFSVEDYCRFLRHADDTPALPLAKLIPTLSDCFHFLSKTDEKSIIGGLLNGDCVKRFCLRIFDNVANQ